MAPARTRLLLTSLIIALYIGFATRVYDPAGVLAALQIENVAAGKLPMAVLFDPAHFLYGPAGYLLFRLAGALGFHGRALVLLQGLNIVASVVTAALVFVIARRLTNSHKVAMFSLALFAFGAAWWKLSTDANSYIVAVLFATAAMYVLWREQPRVTAAAACVVAGLLFDIRAALMCLPATGAILLKGRWPSRRRFVIAGIYFAACACAALGIYWIGSPRPEYRALFAWNSWQPQRYFASWLELFAGARYALARAFLSLPIYLGLVLCLGGLVLACILFYRPQPHNESSGNGQSATVSKNCTVVLYVWVAIYALVQPIFLWPPLVLLIALWIAKSEWRIRRASAFLALSAAIAAFNFASYIYPQAQPAADPVITFAKALDRQLPLETRIYYSSLNSEDRYLEYFAPNRRWTSMPAQPDGSWLRGTVNSSHVPVCFETSALDQLEASGALNRAALSTGAVERWNLINKEHRIRFECFSP